MPPGNYVILARFDDAMDLGSRDRVRYMPTYYPGTPAASEAQHVTVGLGQEMPGMTIALARAATATVRGVVRSSDQASFGPFTVVSAREINGPQAQGHTATAIAAGDGSFAIAGLLPGAYLVEARSSSGSEFASTEVVVDGSDISGATLMLSKGATARGPPLRGRPRAEARRGGQARGSRSRWPVTWPSTSAPPTPSCT